MVNISEKWKVRTRTYKKNCRTEPHRILITEYWKKELTTQCMHLELAASFRVNKPASRGWCWVTKRERGKKRVKESVKIKRKEHTHTYTHTHAHAHPNTSTHSIALSHTHTRYSYPTTDDKATLLPRLILGLWASQNFQSNNSRHSRFEAVIHSILW